jgi:hypothetical protein
MFARMLFTVSESRFHTDSLLLFILHMEAAYTSETWATLPRATKCKGLRAESVSIVYYNL